MSYIPYIAAIVAFVGVSFVVSVMFAIGVKLEELGEEVAHSHWFLRLCHELHLQVRQGE